MPVENVATFEAGRHLLRGTAAADAADEGVETAAVGEGQAVAVGDPGDHADHADGGRLHQHRQHVLLADEAAVEQRQARE